jgi:P-type Ca2+ transporter type 2C
MNRTVPLQRLEGLEGAELGLSHSEALARQDRYGANRIVEDAGTGWRSVARETIKDPMLWFLLGTGLLFGWVGEYTQAVVLMVALVPLFGMDAYLHRRTQASTEGLSGRLATQASVLRDGVRETIAAVGLVPGDLVIVGAGEAFPADGLIVSSDRLQVDESALTGEAYPVQKKALSILPRYDDEARVDAVSWGFAGTRLLTGEARLRIVYTGGETLYGEIVHSALRGSHDRTPLQRAVANLVTLLVVTAVVVCVFLAWVRIRQGHGMLDALLSALTLAVAAIPEEFPVVLTFFLGVGVYRLAKRKALVRRAVVVENIGRVSCICSDKTGTITEGRLHLAHRFAAGDTTEDRLLEIAAAASRLETGDPMDRAILDIAPRTFESSSVMSFPFTEDRKRETGIIREDGAYLAAVKGAPEAVFGSCELSAEDITRWKAKTRELAGSGHKVIACAWRELDATMWPGGEPDRGFRLAGLLAFEDPVRAGVPESLGICRRAGIHVIMVTGDHEATATAVAREIGLGGGSPTVIDGTVMTDRIKREGGRFLKQVDVIARAIPAQKLDLVQTLRSQGDIVAVTGDGVNDVPALQAADIGIAMGGRGTRSAREVAAIILLDDNFRSIVRAIGEGRQLFTNLQMSFQYLLMIHIPLIITAAMIPLAGYPLLYLPIHIVWLEMIIHPTALLVFQDLPDRETLDPRPRNGPLRFFGRRQWLSIVLVGALVTVAVIASYDRSLGPGLDVEHARAMALVALTTASAGITAALSRLRGLTSKVIVSATVGFTVLLIQIPAVAALLHLKPLHPDDWAIAVGGGLLASLPPAIGWFRTG